MNLEFAFSFGFRRSIKDFVFYDDHSVLSASGKFCVLFDFTSRTQKPFQFAERSEVSALSKCSVLIAAALRGEPPSVCLINALSDTRKFYVAPSSMVSSEFICVSISASLKLVAAQGGQPDWLLVFWLSQNKDVLATYSPARGPECSVQDISFHASDRDELVVVGREVFKLYEYQGESEDGENSPFEEHVFEKFEKGGAFHSICWPQKENLAVGTSDGRIVFFRGIELIHEMSVAEDVRDLFDVDEEDVTSIVTTEHHLFCVFGGHVILVYSGEEIRHYKLFKFVSLQAEKSSLIVPGEITERRDSIINVLVSPNDNDLIASTRDGQMMIWQSFAKGSPPHYLTTILHRQHNDFVSGLDVAKGRPVIATSSRHVISLWNYENKYQELRKTFQDDITDITIHPSGLYVAVSFLNCFRIFSILYSDLGERGYVASESCHKVGFSSGGHLLAVACRHTIKIYSFPSLSFLTMLDGHAGTIASFDWNESDTVLVSCDVRGVLCEWSLAYYSKNWEVTAILSYTTVSMNSETGNILAVSTDSGIHCFKNASRMWKMQSRREPACATFFKDGKGFLAGTMDGCLEFYSSHESSGDFLTYAHSGKVSGLRFNCGYDVAVSSGADGTVFLWKVSGENSGRRMKIYADLTLVGSGYLADLKSVLKQIWMSIQHTDTASDCELELSRIRHEKQLRNVALEHEENVEDLNEKMARIKEEIQHIIFDTNSKEDLIELDLAVKNEIIDTTAKLNEAYAKSNAYANETESIIHEYEETINDLGHKHAKFSYGEHNVMEEIMQRIKYLENMLFLEKGITERALSAREKCKEETQTKMYKEASTLKSSQVDLLEEKKSQFIQLQLDVERLKHLTVFQAQDTQNRQNVTSGQIDYDLKEKTNVITALQEEFKKLENILDSKEKIVRKRERQFCEMRERVGSFHKRHSVSKTALDELLEEVRLKESEIESCRKDITEIQKTVGNLQEQTKAIGDFCQTVTEKLGDSVEGFRKKEKVLQDAEEDMKRFFSMLRNYIAKDYDPFKLVQEMTTLFESRITGSAQEVPDFDLLREFESQIGKLKSSHDLVKGEPSEAMRNKYMAEFRLSQENSKILREVHSVQKEAEKLRLVINEMEAALGLYTAKSTKKTYELRDKIEFVIDSSKKDRANTRKLSHLDEFIEEQQKEISRFQNMLSRKTDK